MDANQLLEEVKKLSKEGYAAANSRHPSIIHPDAFIREDSPDVVRVSAEDGGEWCNYWRGCWIDPLLERFAERHRMFWEWENAAVIALYPV